MSDTIEHPYLVENYAPVDVEITAFDLPVTGTIPEALNGLLARNGPNPYGPVGADHHWFLGHAMVHGLRVRGGRAEWYRNRWVRTDGLARVGPFEAAPSASVRAPIAAVAGVNVVSHAGRLLSLGEVGLPWELDHELSTVREVDFDGRMASNFTAHPKFDPATGEMVAFGYDFGPQIGARTHVFDASGVLVHSEDIEVRPSMMHDAGVTATRTVLMDLPVLFDLGVLSTGRQMPFGWTPDAGARLGVLPRRGTSAEVTWIDIDPCYVFHVVNAHDERAGDSTSRIVMDVVRYDSMFDANLLGPDETRPGTTVRWEIDPVTRSVSETVLDDRPVEFPRVDPRVETRPHRFSYAAILTGHRFDTSGLLGRDHGDGSVSVWEAGGGRMPGEPVFVPSSAESAEGDGWLLSVVFDPSTQRSDVVIIDAQDLAAGPVATVHLPVRVPYGFHGSWVPA